MRMPIAGRDSTLQILAAFLARTCGVTTTDGCGCKGCNIEMRLIWQSNGPHLRWLGPHTTKQ